MLVEYVSFNGSYSILQHFHSIVGWGSTVGSWTRVEGSPTELDPNRPHATTDNFYLFDAEGKLLPSKIFEDYQKSTFHNYFSHHNFGT